MAAARATARPVPVAVAGFNFGAEESYSGGFSVPDGKYVWEKVTVMLHAGFGQNAGNNPARLGVMLDLLPLDDPRAEERKQVFYSFGSKATESFMPNDNGTGIDPIPNAKGGTLNDSTNWKALRDSLYSGGLPQGILQDDMTVLEGMWAQMQNVPEPSERKGFANTAATGEAAVAQPQQRRGSGQILVVSEILDDGKPWEGTGGIPEAPAKPAARVNGRAAAAPAAAPRAAAPRQAAAPKAPAPVEAVEAFDVEVSATEVVADVLGVNPEGMPKASLRPKVFTAAKKKFGDENAQLIIETYFADDETLAGLLASLEYQISAGKVKPVA